MFVGRAGFLRSPSGCFQASLRSVLRTRLTAAFRIPHARLRGNILTANRKIYGGLGQLQIDNMSYF